VDIILQRYASPFFDYSADAEKFSFPDSPCHQAKVEI